MGYTAKQYDSTLDFVGDADLKNIVDPSDKDRIKAYSLYDDMYHNRPETFTVTLRGDSDVEIYIPSLRKYTNAVSRYLCVGMDFIVDPDRTAQVAETTNEDGTTNDAATGVVAQLTQELRALFDRERIPQKLNQQKRTMLNQGDAVWHITADDLKPEDKISIHTVDPAQYFPEEDDDGKVIAVMLVDEVPDPREQTGTDKTCARVQKYTREFNLAENNRKVFTGTILSKTEIYEIGAWDYRNQKSEDLKLVSTTVAEFPLPANIKSIPVYHIPNTPPRGSSWGLSIAAGIEYIINAINQSSTYEDLTLILNGLGIYVSTAGPPTDNDSGQPTTYDLSPGSVAEIGEGQDFRRVSGVTTVEPFREHIKGLDEAAQQAIGIPDIAMGSVDVATVESGVALALKMGPLLAENADRELEILGVMNQMLHDLVVYWFPTYGLTNPGLIPVRWKIDDPMPVNREKKLNEIILLQSGGLITFEMAQEEITKLGYRYPERAFEIIALQQQLLLGTVPGDDTAGVDEPTDDTEETDASVTG